MCIYILIRYWVCLSVCPCVIETTFPLSNFKSKHIYIRNPHGPAEVSRSFGAPKAPKLFYLFLFLPPPKAALSEDKGNAIEGGCFASIYICIRSIYDLHYTENLLAKQTTCYIYIYIYPNTF